MHLANYYCAHCIIWMQTCHSLFLSVHCICRPAGIPVVPVYEEDEPNTRRKVQRITSPEKWELKQVNIDSEKKNNTIIQDRTGAHVVYKGSCASCSYCYVGETSAHVSSPVPPPRDRYSHVLKHFRIQILVVSLVRQIVSMFLILWQLFQVEFFSICYIKWPDLNEQVRDSPFQLFYNPARMWGNFRLFCRFCLTVKNITGDYECTIEWCRKNFWVVVVLFWFLADRSWCIGQIRLPGFWRRNWYSTQGWWLRQVSFLSLLSGRTL